MSWQGEICKRCMRRNCVGFSVPDEIWTAVAGDLFSLLCTSCFDELAELMGVKYEFVSVWPVSWSQWEAA